jgi:cellulose synthase/poly-beta-1,6-N-acetylglucosamine synthase-like glycosyltransferase
MSLLAFTAQVALSPLLGCIALPCLVFGTECCIAKASPERPPPSGHPRAVVLIPAHDEAAGIGGVVASLRTQVTEHQQLLVVADNCTDETARIARAAGAEVIERNDPARRGKGYAISFALEHLAKDPPAVVVIVDADCELAPGALQALVSDADRLDRPVQADYLLEAPQDAKQALLRISAFAVLVRNRVRPLGLHRLGLPCQLTGSGMAFPWRQLAGVPSMGDNIVEDLALGLNLALAGHAPCFCPRAKVRSLLPESSRGERTQRRRWETGQLATLLEYAPRLFLAGLREHHQVWLTAVQPPRLRRKTNGRHAKHL